MPTGLDLKIELRGLRELRKRFNKLRTSISAKRELHRRWGIQTLNWIDNNFRQEGRLGGAPWAKLSENTIAGRRRKSRTILQDVGELRRSFTSEPSSTDVKVGTAKFYAPFHEEGGTRWYDIRPVRAKALAFPVARGTQGASKVGASFSSTATRRTYRKGLNVMVRTFVRHPPLTKRKMLPTATNPDLQARLQRTAINLMKEVGPELK